MAGMELIAYPFRVTPSRSIATVEEGTLEHASDAVAVMLLTRKGERPLVPDFGTSDPTFNYVDLAELQVCLDTFGPDGVTVDLAGETNPNDSTSELTLQVSIDDNDEE